MQSPVVGRRAGGVCGVDRCSGSRDVDPEGAALPLLALDPYHAVVRLGYVADDRQAKARAPGAELGTGRLRGTRARPVNLVEALEDARQVAGGDPDAVIADRETYMPRPHFPADPNRALGVAELDRVVDEVDERLFEPCRIGGRARRRFRAGGPGGRFEPGPIPLRPRAHGFAH